MLLFESSCFSLFLSPSDTEVVEIEDSLDSIEVLDEPIDILDKSSDNMKLCPPKKKNYQKAGLFSDTYKNVE